LPASLFARTWLSPLSSLRERVLATLVFTDVVDSTGTARRIGDRALADLITVHDQRLTETVNHFKGEVAKFTGDGMLALFDGAARAVRCARACDRAVSDLGLTLRAAVHTGEIEVAGDQIQGLAINEAARILELAGAHEVLVSATTVQLAAESGMTFEDRGTHELRGIAAARQLFALA
jgi:class 3 adenylate cyclase